jgi:hypothetical protein
MALIAIAFSSLPQVSAEERERTHTVMTVSEMCSGCVKKITKRFEGVERVAKVECSIEKQSVTVIPKDSVRPRLCSLRWRLHHRSSVMALANGWSKAEFLRRSWCMSLPYGHGRDHVRFSIKSGKIAPSTLAIR